MPDPAVSETLDVEVLLTVLARAKSGDFSARMPLAWTGAAGKVADGLNDLMTANETLEQELGRVSRVVGRQGELSQRAALGGWTQSWAGSLESVNSLIDALVRPTSEMQRVIGAVADGDLSKKVTADVRGEMLELKNTINAMVDQLNGFVSEVSRVAREVGTEGKLGQAAAFTTEVGGVWKDLTDNVNLMAGNLTGQVRNIAEVTTAVANGDLSKKISIDVKGEFLELKNTVNAMVDQLKTLAGEVTRVAREVGVEGKLGGQTQSKEVVGGVWKDLTDNVNQLAANLTNQVRAIAEVATAVTEGDLTRQVRVEASGEVAVLKDKLNEMIRNLRETTRQNVEQDWLKTNRERFTRMLQGQDDLTTVSSMILSELATLVSAQHGVLYTLGSSSDAHPHEVLEMQAGYGYEERKHLSTTFRVGEGLVGQCAKERKRILLTDVPADYVRINSGLGEAVPLNIIVLPVLFEGSLRAVIELASFSPFSVTHQAFLDSITESVGIMMNTIQAAGLTESLLKQSQTQAHELRSQQEELRSSNEDLARQARLLADQNVVTEQKNLEVEESKRLIEEKVNQLAVSSTYKSEFIANMSHELRTPLNSLLILAQQLESNFDGNMTPVQVEYASVIHSSGKELLALLNSILDLAKMESGTVTPTSFSVSIDDLRTSLLREFEPVAQKMGLEFAITVAPDAPAVIITDQQRLRQILKNLIANAIKFTETGSVRMRIGPATDGWGTDALELTRAPAVIAFSVSDTGIGIDSRQQQRIFEAFAQGDGTTSRLYGGTGLGLSISRELSTLLGGEIHVVSSPGHGSTFTVYLPAAREDHPRPADPDPSGDLPRQRSGVDTSAPDPESVEPKPYRQRAPEPQPERAPDGARDPAPDPAKLAPSPGFLRPREPGAASLEGVNVLVVDDNYGNSLALTALLERYGAHVTVVESGREAIVALKQNPEIDIVLMDIVMPGMDGYDTMRAIRGMDQFKSLAIVALTGKVMAGERKRCMDAGADDYVPTPVNAEDLLSGLTPWLPARALGSEAARAPSRPNGRKPDSDRGRPPDPAPPSPAPQPDPLTDGSTTSVPNAPPVRAAAAVPRRRAGHALPPDDTLEGVTILVVDDDYRNIFALTALLERSRALVMVAESGAEAINLLETTPAVDIVLMDVMMPVMDGYATMRAIRARPQFASLPIVAVTGKSTSGERQRCLDAGADDYIPKPVDAAELLNALAPWVPAIARTPVRR